MKNTFAAIKFWMDKILSIACAVLLTFMTVLVLIQVFSRYILNSPVAFTEELVRYSLIWTGFIGAAYAFSTREHMSLTLVRDKFTGKAHTALLVAIDGLILLLAIFVITIVMGDFVTIGVMGGQQIASVGKIIQVQTSYLQFPLAAANAVILLAVVLMIIWGLTRLVDIRKEL